MARAITVKVATPKVINALETKLASLEKEFAEKEANEAKYQAEYEVYKKALIAYATENISKAINFRTNYRSWNNNLNIDFDLTVSEKELPTEPQREFNTMNEYEFRNTKSEINNALNILRMTDEEYVNASTMKSIAQYL
jgi:hypothetical protein